MKLAQYCDILFPILLIFPLESNAQVCVLMFNIFKFNFTVYLDKKFSNNK